MFAKFFSYHKYYIYFFHFITAAAKSLTKPKLFVFQAMILLSIIYWDITDFMNTVSSYEATIQSTQLSCSLRCN